jgi:hypothetical protein
MAERGGQPGNQNARNAKRWQQAIRRALARKYGTVDDGLEQLAAKLIDAADQSERWAIEEVGNREDGKPAQAIVGDDDFDSIKVEGRIKLVRPK